MLVERGSLQKNGLHRLLIRETFHLFRTLFLVEDLQIRNSSLSVDLDQKRQKAIPNPWVCRMHGNRCLVRFSKELVDLFHRLSWSNQLFSLRINLKSKLHASVHQLKQLIANFIAKNRLFNSQLSKEKQLFYRRNQRIWTCSKNGREQKADLGVFVQVVKRKVHGSDSKDFSNHHIK